MALRRKAQVANIMDQRTKSDKLYFIGLMLYAIYSMLLFSGCASVGQKDTVLALVDGEPVTEGDLKYSLTIRHRKEDLSSAGALDLMGYVNKMIDDRLLVHEARSAGMDRLPEIRQAVEAYVLRESVVRLHRQEIVERVSVTDDEMKDYYRQYYEQFRLGTIEMKSEPPDDEFDKVRDSIQKTIRKNRERERSDEYLQSLRAETSITVHEGLLSQLKKNIAEKDTEKATPGEQPLVEMNGDILTSGEFTSLMKQAKKRSGEDIIENWIERKLIDQEALRRHYEEQSELRNMLNRYEGELLKQIFMNKIIRPQVRITDEAVEEYYRSHKEDYMKPARYRIQMITANKEEDAKEIGDSLEKGADFSWVARQKSADSSAQNSGERGWITKADLPMRAGELIDTMNSGDVSPVIKTAENAYFIFKLQDSQREQVEDLDRVRDAVRQALFSERINMLLQQYLNKLKESAEIKVFGKEILSLEAGLQK